MQNSSEQTPHSADVNRTHRHKSRRPSRAPTRYTEVLQGSRATGQEEKEGLAQPGADAVKADPPGLVRNLPQHAEEKNAGEPPKKISSTAIDAFAPKEPHRRAATNRSPPQGLVMATASSTCSAHPEFAQAAKKKQAEGLMRNAVVVGKMNRNEKNSRRAGTSSVVGDVPSTAPSAHPTRGGGEDKRPSSQAASGSTMCNPSSDTTPSTPGHPQHAIPFCMTLCDLPEGLHLTGARSEDVLEKMSYFRTIVKMRSVDHPSDDVIDRRAVAHLPLLLGGSAYQAWKQFLAGTFEWRSERHLRARPDQGVTAESIEFRVPPPCSWAEWVDALTDFLSPPDRIPILARAITTLKQKPGQSVLEFFLEANQAHFRLMDEAQRLLPTWDPHDAAWKIFTEGIYENGLLPKTSHHAFGPQEGAAVSADLGEPQSQPSSGKRRGRKARGRDRHSHGSTKRQRSG